VLGFGVARRPVEPAEQKPCKAALYRRTNQLEQAERNYNGSSFRVRVLTWKFR
jgi:hypothetical protein